MGIFACGIAQVSSVNKKYFENTNNEEESREENNYELQV